MKNNPNVVWSKTFLPKEYENKIDKNTIWQKLYEKEIDESIQIVRDEIKNSQYNTITNTFMIPLCVPYSEKDIVKQLGGVWDPQTKSWFWSFEKDQKLVEKWLPRIYQTNSQSPHILPRLVPEPLWYLNLRSFLSKEQWDTLKKFTYEQSGYRCIICGCKGIKWPVECDEKWSYNDNNCSKPAIVHFEGLQSICPGCHQVHHFGKARVDGNNDISMARLIVLNGWSSIQKAQETVDKAFEEWTIRSSIDKWLFNLDVLEERYGISISENTYLKRATEFE